MTSKQVVLITGASGQVGSALATRLSASAPLVMFDRAAAAPAGLASTNKSLSVAVDLMDEAALAEAMQRVHRELGTVRAVVHTVGGYADGENVVDQSIQTVRRMFDLNVVAAVNVVKAALPDVLASEHGRIVLFASADALHGRAGASAYAASKAALLRFAEALGEEVTPQGVGVRVILPTTIDTPKNRAAMPDAPFERWVTLPQVADSIEFLISPASAGIRFALIPLGR